MQTSKSTLAVARMALRAAEVGLQDYSHPKSPHKFSQPQLAACLVIKEFLKLDYRGIQILLSEWSDLRKVLSLKKVPHFTTLCAANKRLLCKTTANVLLAEVLSLARKTGVLERKTKQAAIDSTGLETRHVSAYYTKRCNRHKGHIKHHYPKLSAVCDTSNHLILGIVIDRGPKPDAIEDEQTINSAIKHQWFDTILGDAGYESERFHSYCRDGLGIISIFPTTNRGRPRHDGAKTPINGHYRKLMNKQFPKKTYGQRWQIETVFSMIKRNQGAALSARNYHSQNRQIRLKVLTHNLAIICLLMYLLYRAALSLFITKSRIAETCLGWQRHSRAAATMRHCKNTKPTCPRHFASLPLRSGLRPPLRGSSL